MTKIPLVLENDPYHIIGYIRFSDIIARDYIVEAMNKKVYFSFGGGFIKKKNGKYKIQFLSIDKAVKL